MPYALNLHNVTYICQLYLSKPGGNVNLKKKKERIRKLQLVVMGENNGLEAVRLVGSELGLQPHTCGS